MSLKEDLEAAKAVQEERTLQVPVVINDVLYQVEVSRLQGTVWDEIVSRAPARAERHTLVGYDTTRATQIACRSHGKLLAANGDEQSDFEWDDIFSLISGTEFGSISAAWWGLNVKDPDESVRALKKASAGGDSTTSNSPSN